MIREAWDRVWVARRGASLFLLLPEQIRGPARSTWSSSRRSRPAT